MSSRIRKAQGEELPIVIGILDEVVAWMEQFGDSLWTEEEVSSQAMQADFDAGDYYLVIEGEQIVATFLMQDHDSYYWPEAGKGEALYLHRIAVRRAFAGSGHSKAVLRFAMEQARKRGIDWIRLDCDFHRKALNNLYTKLGFAFHSEVVIGDYHGNRYQLSVTSAESKE
ncbi:MAG: GNAT family N-acetyltransferase [Planctomycetes bacterium]|nr:GNAT family N-acetyltransferase [Planctomycetota bacterium]MCP4771368.1 GNAT family N-acetyltransferase [Planctomycetota bacterium]MCP4861805.1 GNAT family N-acetyltransferase [Planctomycetota bacterium]